MANWSELIKLATALVGLLTVVAGLISSRKKKKRTKAKAPTSAETEDKRSAWDIALLTYDGLNVMVVFLLLWAWSYVAPEPLTTQSAARFSLLIVAATASLVRLGK
jgi:hypothetical protein